MVIKSLKKDLRKKVDSWKENENLMIENKALKLGYQATINLTEKVEEPIKKQLAETVLNRNVEFYLNVAAIQRAEEMSLIDYFKYEVYCFLDKLV